MAAAAPAPPPRRASGLVIVEIIRLATPVTRSTPSRTILWLPRVSLPILDSTLFKEEVILSCMEIVGLTLVLLSTSALFFVLFSALSVALSSVLTPVPTRGVASVLPRLPACFWVLCIVRSRFFSSTSACSSVTSTTMSMRYIS